MNLPPENDIEQQIEKITCFIDTAQRLISQGKPVDLKALEEKISSLCSNLEQLPPLQANKALPPIEKLFESVKKLEQDVTAQHDSLTERLQLGQRHAIPLMAQEVDDDDS